MLAARDAPHQLRVSHLLAVGTVVATAPLRILDLYMVLRRARPPVSCWWCGNYQWGRPRCVGSNIKIVLLISVQVVWVLLLGSLCWSRNCNWNRLGGVFTTIGVVLLASW